MDKKIRILNGLHAGVQLPCERDAQCSIGSDSSCSIVLCDAGVAAKHCLLSVDSFGITCRALDAPLTVGARQIAEGQVLSLADFQIVQCGPVRFSVGPVVGDWPELDEADARHAARAVDAVRSLKRLNPYGLFAGILLGLTCALGLAYTSFSAGDTKPISSRVEAARRWLSSIAPRGSELEIGIERAQDSKLLLSGYVPRAYQLAQLDNAAERSGLDPRVEVHAVDDILASLSRAAKLERVPCTPQYQGSGEIACADAIEDEVVAAKLHRLARDVPGVRALHVKVAPRPVLPAQEPAATPAAVPRTPAQLTEKFAVLMIRDRRYLIGRYGKKYLEGDEFDGFLIRHIGLDQVMFERDGRSYEFQVAALGRSGDARVRF